jgi:prepilin-type N-terminal cleavage/methylation domain-containing protein/prepilin-type processing-associated H-X9-DG protein
VFGFTLIELLVVVGVIAVMIAILLPSLGRSRRQAQRVTCMTNMRALGSGSQIYTSEFENAIVWGGYAEGDRPIRSVGWWAEPTSWFNAMPKYAGQPTFFEQSERDRLGTAPMKHRGDSSIFICPVAAEPFGYGEADTPIENGCFMMFGTDEFGYAIERRRTYWCYGFNTQLDGGKENRNTPPTYHVWQNMRKMTSPQTTILLTEKIMRADELTPAFPNNVCQSLVSWREFPTRHDGGGMILFLDNHVEYVTRAEVYRTESNLNMNKPGSIVWNPDGPAN